VRVVAGSAKGRRLVAPAGRETRPTSDRVREAVFNSLHSLGVVDGARALDLFAGSGALGVEALSRGAQHCTFVEQARPALEAIRANLAATGLADRATVVASDVLSWLARTRPEVDLAMADPPYAFDGWSALLDAIVADVVALESDRPIELGPAFGGARSRRYGGTVVTLGRRTSPREESQS
jgi:16S rRNA (guanine966-N2)-methyltransferase